MSSVKIVNGDCLEILKKLPDECADSVVTDPPYEIGFMGKGHDSTGIAFNTEMWAECLRVLKPGGHLLSFGASKTYHRMAVAVEDAGFEIRDAIFWCYGSGFPKSMSVAKAVESQILNGASNPRALRKTEQEGDGESYQLTGKNNGILGETRVYDRKTFSPNTDEAKQWDGWGTALKPAVEPIVVARKPLSEKTVAKNVLKHGTGGINVDGCRIGSDEDTRRNARGGDNGLGGTGTFQIRERRAEDMPETSGRWPANLILGHSEDCQQVGTKEDSFARNTTEEWSGVGQKEKPDYESEKVTTSREVWECVESCPVADLDKQSGQSNNDSGGASRFFHNFQMESPLIYQAKANKKERPLVDGKGHSTVKPLSLMQNLVRLVTPPGGTVLEPFAGSGTTLEAAVLEGFNAIGIEMTEEYIPLIEQRLARQGMVKKNSVAWETVDD